MESKVPIVPAIIVISFMELLVIFAKEIPEAYKALLFVDQMFRPKDKIAGMAKPCIISVSKISALPKAAAPVAPKINIKIFPTKNAITVALIAPILFWEKRVKFGVEVPPDMKLPITILKAIAIDSGLRG